MITGQSENHARIKQKLRQEEKVRTVRICRPHRKPSSLWERERKGKGVGVFLRARAKFWLIVQLLLRTTVVRST
jgi:hypothetical protein